MVAPSCALRALSEGRVASLYQDCSAATGIAAFKQRSFNGPFACDVTHEFGGGGGGGGGNF